ncbi:MAG: hypothetical protein Kow0032_04950 [Methyloligellaceae bacterium]
MHERCDEARALIEIALATFREEIQPGVGKEQRYTAAMIAHALGIAARMLAAPDAGETLARAMGTDSPGDLARALRTGSISCRTHPDLAQRLLEHVRAELQITNPRFLAGREESEG